MKQGISVSGLLLTLSCASQALPRQDARAVAAGALYRDVLDTVVAGTQVHVISRIWETGDALSCVYDAKRNRLLFSAMYDLKHETQNHPVIVYEVGAFGGGVEETDCSRLLVNAPQ